MLSFPTTSQSVCIQIPPTPPYPAIAVILSCFNIQPASPRSKAEYSVKSQLEFRPLSCRTFKWMKRDLNFFFYWACEIMSSRAQEKCHLYKITTGEHERIQVCRNATLNRVYSPRDQTLVLSVT